MAFPSAFQQSAFQNDCDGGLKGFQCVATLPKPGTEVESVFIDSTVELAADHFSAKLAAPTTLFNDTTKGNITIQLGLKQGCVTPQTITHMDGGVIDEYEIRITPNEQNIMVRGRDQMASILDCEFNKTYIRANYLSNGVLDTTTQSQIDSMAAKTITFRDGTIVTIPAKVIGIDWVLGVFTAKQIAQDLATAAGLQLLWQVRDYTLMNTFAAVGRRIETLKKLLAPWTTLEPFKAEVFVMGNQLIVRHRQLPGKLFTQIAPDYVFDAAAMKRSEITVRKRFMFGAHKIRLVGRLQQINSGLVTVVDPTGETVDVTTTTVVPATGADPNQKTIVVTTTYHLPEQIVLHQIKDVFSPQKVEHTETWNDYEDTDVGKLLRTSRTTTDKWDEAEATLAAFERTTQFNTYDDVTFLLRNQTTVIEDIDPLIANYVASKMIVKTIVDAEPGMVEERTAEYAPSAGMSDGAAAAAGSAFWDLVRQDVQMQAGHRAGGSGRKGIFIPNFPGTMANIEIDATLSTNTCAPNITVSNENLTLQDLQFLLTLYQANENFSFEYEVQFDGVAMPWLQKGVVIKVNNLLGPWGDPIILPPLYITEVRTTFDESKRNAEFKTQVRAFAWQ